MHAFLYFLASWYDLSDFSPFFFFCECSPIYRTEAWIDIICDTYVVFTWSLTFCYHYCFVLWLKIYGIVTFSPQIFFNSQNMFIVLDPPFEKLLFVEYTICVSFFRNSGKRFARVYIRGIKKKEVPRNSHHDSDNCPPTETKTEQKKNKKRTVKTTEHRGRFLELS